MHLRFEHLSERRDVRWRDEYGDPERVLSTVADGDMLEQKWEASQMYPDAGDDASTTSDEACLWWYSSRRPGGGWVAVCGDH